MLKNSNKSKTIILGTVLLIVFIAEVLVMGILHLLKVESAFHESLIDGVLLAFLSAPFIYYYLIKDISTKNTNLKRSLKRQRRAEDALISSQAELHHLSEKLIQSEEEHRKAVAFELHDSIGQSIFAIKLGIENLLQEYSSSLARPIQNVLLDQLVKLQNACEEVRNISMNLRPSMLDDLGLLATIKWLTREFRNLYPDISFEVEIEVEEEALPIDLKIVIFRIIQESLNNMGKHSKANKVSVKLWLEDGKIHLTIIDDGQGFELRGSFNGEGIGLSSMKERVKLSKGQFSLISRPNQGTKVCAQWRIDPSNNPQ
ncbi:MAG: sensor histidine kinase [Enterobacterales bacterium]|nr:sensor histidine kinase [Enterobacterales bacterium]